MNVDFIVRTVFARKRATLGHDKIFKAILATLNDSRVNPIALFSEYNIINSKSLVYSFHPAADPVYFDFEEDNQLKVSINTGSLGAGYHAFFVSILDRLAKRLDILWTEDEEIPDKTLYFSTRNFDDLKLFFATSLKHYSENLINHFNKGFSNFMLSMPYGYPLIEKDFFALSPLGYWGKSFFLDITNSVDDDLLEFADEFFIWENSSMDASFWFKSALSMIWLYYPFRSPIDSLEEDLYRKILYSFEMAYKSDTSFAYPWAIWRDIANYIDDDIMIKEIQARKPERVLSSQINEIGFRSEFGRSILSAGFSIVMPMSMTKYRNHKTLIEFKNDKLYIAFEVYSFEEENTEAIMEYIIRQIEDINDETTKEVKFDIENNSFKTSLYEKYLDTGDYMLVLALSSSKIALLAWFTYEDESMKEACLSYIKSITLEK